MLIRMTYQEKATQLDPKEIAELLQGHDHLVQKVQDMESQLKWFKEQLFGQKTERRPFVPEEQGLLFDKLGYPTQRPDEAELEHISYTRKKGPKLRGASVTESGLRFDSSVNVKEIHLQSPRLEGPDADQYEKIGEKIVYRLAQRPSSYVVLKYIQPVVKQLSTGDITSVTAVSGVFEKSIADVSFLVGMLIDKFLYHQPLYRQHQKLKLNGITLARSTLTQLTHRTAELLRPIYDAQWESALLSKVLAMDETPVKAGHKKKGKLQQAYYWPVLGDKDEICFAFAASRGKKVTEKLLSGFKGTLLTDGYNVYERYAKRYNIEHAQCWVHARRYFVKAEKYEPELVQEALEMIAKLYKTEKAIAGKNISGEDIARYRQKDCKPLVDTFFDWCKRQCENPQRLPSDKLSKALNYVMNREKSLRVFLKNPDVVLDTNALERGLRVIPMGKKNWMFCWTEIGAEYVGIIQSLVVTCRMHDINPSIYLVDVLQRMDSHPASAVHELTPRLWKEKFAANPMISDVD